MIDIIKTEETEESGIKYLNINVSNSEAERNPDIVRLCADTGILEYAKPKTGYWKKLNVGYGCSECSLATNKSGVDFYRFCPNCGAKMESEDKE